jgi:hypothetical protein
VTTGGGRTERDEGSAGIGAGSGATVKPIDRPPFSNGTEGEAWMANWCHRCLRDAPFRNGIAPTGCELILTALLGQTPAEWIEQDRFSLGDQYHCIEFRAPGSGGGEPRPRPTPPGQGELVPRDGLRATRMLIQPTESSASLVAESSSS